MVVNAMYRYSFTDISSYTRLEIYLPPCFSYDIISVIRNVEERSVVIIMVDI